MSDTFPPWAPQCLSQGAQSLPKGPLDLWLSPKPSSVPGAELVSPNRGRYKTKQISLFKTLGNTPAKVKGGGVL